MLTRAVQKSLFHFLSDALANVLPPAWRSKSPGVFDDARFDYDLALELLRLTGNVYVEYFATRYGPTPQKWKPASARPNYAAYLLATTPENYTAVCTINLIGGETRWPIGRILRRGKRQFFLVFRGTVSEEEWIKDILVMQTPNTIPVANTTPAGQVHLGFLRMFRQLDPPPEVWAARMQSTNANTKPELFIVGHSLGGALGTLAALQFHEWNPTLMTFGSPRVGDPVFAQTFDALVPRTTRVANHWDPIIHLPDHDVDLLFRKYRYQHVGRLFAVYALSQLNGPSIVEILNANENWRDWKDYVLETLLDPRSGHRLDPLFTHQLRAYEYALVRDRKLAAKFRDINTCG